MPARCDEACEPFLGRFPTKADIFPCQTYGQVPELDQLHVASVILMVLGRISVVLGRVTFDDEALPNEQVHMADALDHRLRLNMNLA